LSVFAWVLHEESISSAGPKRWQSQQNSSIHLQITLLSKPMMASTSRKNLDTTQKNLPLRKIACEITEKI
jgi:hypothetical protein